MSQAVTNIKKRIKSVTGAYKVTSAMKLVSTVRLKQWRNKMLANREYSNQINKTVAILLACNEELENKYIVTSKSSKKLYIVVSSTLGLCGSYNANIFKLADVTLKKEDDAIILGGKAIAHFKDGEFTHIDNFETYNSVQNTSLINQMSKFIIDQYISGKYGEIHIIYSEYKNSLAFTPKDYKILPLKRDDYDIVGCAPLMEPSPEELIDVLMPMYVEDVLYSKLLESEVCEQGARSNAMETATNNAKDLLDNLRIEFNKARQGAITQEITEIVAAAQSL